MKKYRVTVQVNNGQIIGTTVSLEVQAANEDRAKILALSLIAEIDCAVVSIEKIGD